MNRAFRLLNLSLVLTLVSGSGVGQRPPASPPQAAGLRRDATGDALPREAVAQLGTQRYRLGFILRQVFFSPSGKRLAIASAGGGVGVIDRATGRVLWQQPVPAHVYAVAFSPDGRTLAAPGGGVTGRGTVRLLDAETGVEYRQIKANAGSAVMCLAFSPDGRLLATGGHDKAVCLLDTVTSKEIHKLTGHHDSVYQVAFSPDGQTLASTDAGGDIRLWDVATGQARGQIAVSTRKDNRHCCLAFAPQGHTLMTGAADGLRLWDTATGKPGRTLAHADAGVWTVAIARDGQRVAAAFHDGTIRVLEVSSGKEISRWSAYPCLVQTLDFAPDGKALATGGGWFSRVRLWDPATGHELNPCQGHQATVTAVRFTPDGKMLLSAGRDTLVCRWDVGAAKEQGRFHVARFGMPTIAFSQDATVALSQDRLKPPIRVWSAREGKRLRTLPGTAARDKQYYYRTALALSPDRRWLATGGRHVPLALQDAMTGNIVHRPGNTPDVSGVAFSPDGRLLASAEGRSGGKPTAAVRLWDVATGRQVRALGPGSAANSVAFSPDGRLLAMAEDYPDDIVLWEVATGKEVARFHGQESFYTVAFSPDGRLLAGAGGDTFSDVHVWELASHGEARTFHGHHCGVLTLAFTPNGRTLASGGNGIILLWDVTGQQLGRVQLPRTSQQTEALWADLAAGNVGRAVDTVYALAAVPALAVPMLGHHLKPASPLEPRRLAKLVADLDSPRFRTRRRATAELEQAGSGAETALRQALKDSTSPEVRRRLKQVLQTVSQGADHLRQVRAVQILETCRTPEARAILKNLASGMPDARLTQEARTALEHWTAAAGGK